MFRNTSPVATNQAGIYGGGGHAAGTNQNSTTKWTNQNQAPSLLPVLVLLRLRFADFLLVVCWVDAAGCVTVVVELADASARSELACKAATSSGVNKYSPSSDSSTSDSDSYCIYVRIH